MLGVLHRCVVRGGGFALAEQLRHLRLDLVVEALPQTVGVLGQLVHDLRRDRPTGRVGKGLDLRRRVRLGPGLFDHVVEIVLHIDELDLDVVDGPRRVVGIRGSDGGEPCAGRFLLPLCPQEVGVGRREPKPRGLGAVQLGRIGSATEGSLEHEPRRRHLAEVAAGAGLHDPQLEGILGIRPVGERFGDEPQRDVDTPEGPFAVGEDGPIPLVAAHPPVGADLPRRLGEVARVIGRDPDRLTDGGDPGCAIASRTGMHERGLGVLVEQAARSHQVGGNPLGIAGIEAAQRCPDRWVQVAIVDPLGDLRTGRQRRTTLFAGTGRGPARTVTGGAPVLPAAARRPRPLGAIPGRPVTLRTAVAPLAPRAAGMLRPLSRRPLALRTAVLPRGAVARRPVPVRATVLPLAARSAGALGTVALRAAVLPLATGSTRTLGTVARGALAPRRSRALRPVPLRAAVLPLASRRSDMRRAVALRAAVLPLPARSTRTLRAVAGRALTSWRARALRPVALRAAVLPLGTVTRRSVALRAAVLPLPARST